MPVSAEVLAALKQSGLPLAGQACLGTLSWGEGGRSFLTLYGDSAAHPHLYSGPLDHFPTPAEWPGGTGPSGKPTSALGFLQFLRGTYAECSASTGLVGIDPQSQIANGWWLAQHDYGKHTGGGDLLAALQDGRTKEVAMALVSTWPGGADPAPNHTTGFPGFPAAYAAFLATLPGSGPSPPPPPPAPLPTDPVASALDSVSTVVGKMSTDIRRLLARLAASHPDPQSIVTRLGEITAQLNALSDSIENALSSI